MRIVRSLVIGLGLALAATMAVAQAQTPGPVKPRLPGAAAQPSATLSQKAPEAAKIAQAAEQQGYVSIIVEFAPPIPRSAMRPDPAVLEPLRARVRSVQDAIIASHFGSAANPRAGQGFSRGIRRLDISPMFGVNVNAAELEALAADPRVLRIHENALKQPLLEQSVPLVGMAGAYSAGATGNGYAVAVVDTGVKADHPFLSGKVILEACFSKNGGFSSGTSTCPNGQPTQTGSGSASPTSSGCLNGSTNLCYHGTHVAGIAAGLNSTNIAGAPPNGVAKSADIVAIQVFTNINNSVSAYTTDIISGLNYIYSNLNNLPGGIKVAAVNMSLGGGLYTAACDSDPTKPSIDNLLAAGVATVVAAGNDGSKNSVTSPGCISTAVTVGSSTKGDVISSFSNMASMVDLMAPGGAATGLCNGSVNSDIHSSRVTGTSSTFGCLAGTSMATPHVAGAFAALRTVVPNASVPQMLAALRDTGTAIQDTRSGGTVTKPRTRVDLAAQTLIANSPILLISPSSSIAISGQQGGPFSPASFQYQLSTSSGSVGYSISGLPNWLTASSTSGTATTSATTVTFSVNSAANSLAIGTYGPTTITFTNTTNGLGNDTRTATLTVAPPPPPNDNFANAITIQAGQTLTGTNTSATKEAGEPNLSFNSGGKSVWWKFTAPVSGSFTVNTNGSNFDTILGIFTGSAVNALTLVASDDDSGSNLTSSKSFNATAGTTYSIMVDGYNAASGNIQVMVSAGPSATLVVTPLTDIAASGNQGGPFSPSSFQYQLNASTGSANYAITGLPTWLNVSSSSGTVTTSPTTITFTVNSNANSLAASTYNATISFANTTNGQGNQTRNAALQVNYGGSGVSSAANTFVSARSGTDTGLCQVTAPCATLNYALSVTDAGGRVTIVDSGLFGPIVLTKEVSIVGADQQAPIQIAADSTAQVGCVGAQPSGCGLTNNGYAVEVAAGVNDTVTLTHLLLAAGNNGAGAVKFTSGGKLQLSDDILRGNDTATGPIIALYPNNPGTTQAQVYFTDSDVGFNNSNSNAGGIEVKPSGNTSLKMEFNHVQVHNAAYGLRTDASSLSGPSVVVATAVSDSEFFSFNCCAVDAVSTAGSGTLNGVYNDVKLLNANIAVKVNGPQSYIIFTNSTIAGNGTGVEVQNGGFALTSQNNTITGNNVNVSGSLTPAPRQ